VRLSFNHRFSYRPANCPLLLLNHELMVFPVILAKAKSDARTIVANLSIAAPLLSIFSALDRFFPL
jgi:hypothetical protein